MARRRFYVPGEAIHEGSALLPPAQAHHLRNVLRMENGDTAEVFDGAGHGYVGQVEIRGAETFIRNLAPLPSVESRYHLILAAALIKPARFEWMLQKTTELGIDEIVPVYTRLSQVRIPQEKTEARLERWQRIVGEAARQSGRFAAPVLRRPVEFPALLAAAEYSDCSRILFYEKTSQPFEASSLLSNRILMFIGPEGGWDKEEIRLALESGCRTLGLGRWILRAETAAIAGLAIIQHELNLRSTIENSER